jgi:predicted HAD superfamily hydrolase
MAIELADDTAAISGVRGINARLRAEYRRAISSARVVSFDVFDTLIHRRVYRPTDLFDILAAVLKNNDFGMMHPEIAQTFSRKRVKAESEARMRLVAEQGTPEVNLEEIYDVLTEILRLTPEQREYLKDLELDLEKRFGYGNPVMQEVFRSAAEDGRQVVLCSDMYLPADFINSLLKSCGYEAPHSLFLSSELRKSKHEGTVYREVARHLSVGPDVVVHFGDNPQADVEMAAKEGVKPTLFNYLSIVESGLRMNHGRPDTDPHVWSLINGTIRQELMRRDHDFWEDIGLQVFGPLFLGKILWVTSLARQDGIERMLFFARDAYLHHQVFQRYPGLLGQDVELRYAYFSRAAILLPSFVDMPIDRVWHLFSGRAMRSVGYHFQKLGMDPHHYLGEIRRAGFKSADEIVPNGDIRMFRLLNSLWSNILLEAKRKRELPRRYVAECAEGAKRLGIVDIGWTGNMQGGFSRILQLVRTDYEIKGYYLGTFGMLPQNYLPRNVFRGYLVNENNPWELCESLINGGVELLEFALMAPHGTTLGYQEEDGAVAPILEDNKDDEEVRALARKVQKGAMAFIDSALPIIMDTGLDAFVSLRWSDPFFRLVNSPSMEEAGILGDITHSDTASDTSRRLPLAEKLPENIAAKKGPRYREARERAYWKKAFDLRNS